MATTKISALPAASTVDAADLTLTVNSSVTEKLTVTQAATYVRAQTGAATLSGLTGSAGSLIINTSGADSDTRIAGTSATHLLVVDAGLDRVGIANASPTTVLDVTGTVTGTLLSGSGASITGLGATSTAFRVVSSDPGSPANGEVWYNSTSHAFKCRQAGTTKTFTVS